MAVRCRRRRSYVMLQHVHSGALRRVQLLGYSRTRASVWWPLCGPYEIVIRGRLAGRMLFDEHKSSPWRIVQSHLRRLRSRRPPSLYQSEAQ